MAADEYCVFSLIVQLADWQTGIWIGSAVAVSDYLKWCSRKSQLLLRSLESKGYLGLNIVKGRKGNYAITVRNYHGSPNGDAVKRDISAPGCADKAGSPNGDATLKEVKQEKGEEETRAHPRRAFHSSEQVRRIEAKQTRLAKEAAGWREGQLMEIQTSGKGARKDYIEFLDLRDARKLPTGMTWAKWRNLTPEQKRQILKAA